MRKVITLILAAFMAMTITACSSTAQEESTAAQEESITVQDESTTAQEETTSTQDVGSDVEQEEVSEDLVIYEDDYLKAIYKGVSETNGVIVMTVALENKTDDEITVLPMDSSVDETMVQFTSGTIATVQAGKTFNQGWILSSMPTEEIQFSMYIYDKDMSEIAQTDILTIEME